MNDFHGKKFPAQRIKFWRAANEPSKLGVWNVECKVLYRWTDVEICQP